MNPNNGGKRQIERFRPATPRPGQTPAFSQPFTSASFTPIATPAPSTSGLNFQLGPPSILFRPQPRTTASIQMTQPNLTTQLAKTQPLPLTLGTPATAAPNFYPSITTSSTTGFGGISSTGLSLGTPASRPTADTGFTLLRTVAIASVTATSSTVVVSSSGPSTTTTSVTTTTAGLTINKLEESIGKWVKELKEQEAKFQTQAMEQNAWDRLVWSNAEKVKTLNDEIDKAKDIQKKLDVDLDFIAGQQRELNECLDELEKEIVGTSGTNQERNEMYQLAEKTDAQLKNMAAELKGIIEQLNEAKQKQDPDDPVTQIGRILSAHMYALEFIDRATTEINNSLDTINKTTFM